MNRIMIAAIGAFALGFSAPAVLAEGMQGGMKSGAGMGHGQHGMGMQGMMQMQGPPPEGDQGPASQAFAAANAQMHAAMSFPFTGNPDVDFVKGMIAHHQGAIDMAKVELEYGKDPKQRALAEAIIAAQTKEIADMEAWLAAQPAK